MDLQKINKLIKQHNNIINLYRFYKGIDRSEIGRHLQVSMPTIYSAIDDLCKEKILLKNGNNIQVNPNYGTLIGISIGSSLCKISFLDFSFRLYDSEAFNEHKKKICDKLNSVIQSDELLKQCIQENRNYIYFKTPNTLSVLKQALDCVFSHIKDIIENGTDVLCIGISCTGLINKKNETILSAYNLSYLNNLTLDTLVFPAQQNFFNSKNVNINIVQNSNASAIAEKIYLYQSSSLFKSKRNILTLYLGVGIGAGLYFDHLYSGTSGYAGEVGHLISPICEQEDDKKNALKMIQEKVVDSACTCGRTDCYDYKIRTFVFEKTAKDFCNMSSREIRTYLIENPDKAKLLGKYLGNLVNTLTSIFNMDLIVFSGKLYKSMDLLINHIDSVRDESPLVFSRTDCKDCISDLGPLSPSIGAAIYSYCQKFDLMLSWNYSID